MRKLGTLALIALANFSGFSQPVANASDVAQNFTGEFYFAPADNFDPGAAGANQTWDFSNLQMVFAGTDTAVPSSTTPFASTFPTSNWCYRFSGLGSDRYYYHNLTAEKLEILSLGYNATSGTNYNPDPRTYAVFPYTFNTVYNDTYRAVTDAATTSVTVTYDAYGTLIMPFGTFQNVIRQKTVKNGQADYNWFNVSPFYPILQTVLAENSLGIVKNTTPLANESFAAGSQLCVYPNPTSGRVNMTGSFDAATVDVFSSNGTCILRDGTSSDIDLTDKPAGVYLLRVRTAEGRVFTQRIVRK